VVVIEAAEKSGSLITARFATEQNREVFVVPASINNLNAKGGNALIRSGAMLVENAQQVIDEINTLLSWSLLKQQSNQAELFEPMAEESKQPLPFPQLLANLGVTPVAVDLLSQRTNIPISEVMTQLLELELQGLVTAVPGGYIRV
jgi:DNA processing protein